MTKRDPTNPNIIIDVILSIVYTFYPFAYKKNYIIAGARTLWIVYSFHITPY